MGNSVAVAKQAADKNFCNGNLDYVELCYKGAQQIFTVDEDGDADREIEVWSDEAYAAYYHCTNCDELWEITLERNQDKTFKLVKEHFHEGN